MGCEIRRTRDLLVVVWSRERILLVPYRTVLLIRCIRTIVVSVTNFPLVNTPVIKHTLKLVISTSIWRESRGLMSSSSDMIAVSQSLETVWGDVSSLSLDWITRREVYSIGQWFRIRMTDNPLLLSSKWSRGMNRQTKEFGKEEEQTFGRNNKWRRKRESLSWMNKEDECRQRVVRDLRKRYLCLCLCLVCVYYSVFFLLFHPHPSPVYYYDWRNSCGVSENVKEHSLLTKWVEPTK